MSESTSKVTELKDDRTQCTSDNSDRLPKKAIAALIGDSIIKNVNSQKGKFINSHIQVKQLQK